MSNSWLENSSLISKIEWLCIKIPFIILVYFNLKSTVLSIIEITGEKGICHLINCNLFLFDITKYIIVIWLTLSSILFLFGKFKLFAISSLFLVSLIIFSLEESLGILSRSGIISLIFLSLVIAHYLHADSPEKLTIARIQYPIQVIVACYTLAALSKITVSGISWVTDAEMMIVQMAKINQTRILDGIYHGEVLSPKALFVLEHKVIISLLLFGALCIELFSGLAMINKKTRIVYGFLLVSLHIGIYYFFQILIMSFIIPMVLFLINPFFLIFESFRVIALRLKKYKFNL